MRARALLYSPECFHSTRDTKKKISGDVLYCMYVCTTVPERGEASIKRRGSSPKYFQHQSTPEYFKRKSKVLTAPTFAEGVVRDNILFILFYAIGTYCSSTVFF